MSAQLLLWVSHNDIQIEQVDINEWFLHIVNFPEISLSTDELRNLYETLQEVFDSEDSTLQEPSTQERGSLDSVPDSASSERR